MGKISPKVSPAVSPKTSPKTEPAQAPKGKAEPCPPPTEAEIAEATPKAVELIIKGLKENPKAQDNGLPYIPDKWALEMKPILGPYKKFVESRPELRLVPGANPAKYTVQLSSDTKAKLSNGEKPVWELDLQKAWLSYCRATPKGERNPDEFAETAKNVAKPGLISADGKGKKAAKTAPANEDKDDTAEMVEKSAAKKTKRKREEEDKEEVGDAEPVAKKKKKKTKNGTEGN